MVVISARLVRPGAGHLWRLPLLTRMLLLTPLALAVAHLSPLLVWGSKADPLGHGIVATKARGSS